MKNRRERQKEPEKLKKILGQIKINARKIKE